MLAPAEYSLLDTVRLFRSLIDGVNHVYPQLEELDFEADLPRFEIPVVFITGRYDYTCVQDIAWRCHEHLEAPRRSFHWFERSGHNSCYQEPEHFMDILRQEVLPLTRGAD